MMSRSACHVPVFVAAATFALMSALPADARMLPRFNQQKNMRVSASFQTIVPISGPANVEAEARATEDARRSLYEIASRECSVIIKVFKGTCRISNLNVRSYVQNRGNGVRQIQVSASANYIVTRNPPDSPVESKDDDQRGKKL